MNKDTQNRKLEVEELEKRAAPFGGQPQPIPPDGEIPDQPGGSDGERQRYWKKTDFSGGGSQGPDAPEPPMLTELV